MSISFYFRYVSLTFEQTTRECVVGPHKPTTELNWNGTKEAHSTMLGGQEMGRQNFRSCSILFE